ncbi:hypothetical protein, partial [Escherichia coli]|uniref:hypothetical protein n=1 Tax=Escherichia coli TaxID=562 RepID=UPI001BFDF479
QDRASVSRSPAGEQLMRGRGRPLRFLAMVTIAWVGVRVAMLWPRTGSLPAAIEAASPLARAEPRIAPAAAPPPPIAD